MAANPSDAKDLVHSFRGGQESDLDINPGVIVYADALAVVHKRVERRHADVAIARVSEHFRGLEETVWPCSLAEGSDREAQSVA